MGRTGRGWALAGLAAVTALAAACGRLPGRRRTPEPSPAPAADTGRAAAADTARRDTAAAGDSAARRDSARRADSAAADTGARARGRRTEADPTARCGRVTFNEPRVYPTSRVQFLSDGAGNYISFFGGGVFVRCPAVGSTLRADSAEYYESIGQLILIGNVVYEEPRRHRLSSLRLTYYTNDERLLAEGNVVATLPSGTTMRGPSVDYLRAVQRVRPASRLTAVGRPEVRAVGAAERGRREGAARGRDTSVTTITANTIVDEADSVVYASGSVVITRVDLVATSDSATFDQLSEVARLLRQANIRGTRGRPYTLSGARIDLFARERELTRVVSRDSARIVSDELNLRSDTVDMRLIGGEIDRAFAWGPSGAVATSPERDVVADSIAAVLPGQRVRELWAVRRAVARTVPDSSRIVSKERDLLRGDTIHAQFDTVRADGDTSRTPPVRRIRALGNASSLFQVASQRGRAAPPSINYVRGRNITVDFDTGTVQVVTVTDSAAGVYLEPADSAADSARVDSIAVPVPRLVSPPAGTAPGARPRAPSPLPPATPTPVPPAGTPATVPARPPRADAPSPRQSEPLR